MLTFKYKHHVLSNASLLPQWCRRSTDWPCSFEEGVADTYDNIRYGLKKNPQNISPFTFLYQLIVCLHYFAQHLFAACDVGDHRKDTNHVFKRSFWSLWDCRSVYLGWKRISVSDAQWRHEKMLWGYQGGNSSEVWQSQISPSTERAHWADSFHSMTYTPRPQVLYLKTSHQVFTRTRSLPLKGSIHHVFTVGLKCDVVLALPAKYGGKTSNCFRVVALW